jgi:hypothetical protein
MGAYRIVISRYGEKWIADPVDLLTKITGSPADDEAVVAIIHGLAILDVSTTPSNEHPSNMLSDKIPRGMDDSRSWWQFGRPSVAP